jgi:hypothetical protein
LLCCREARCAALSNDTSRRPVVTGQLIRARSAPPGFAGDAISDGSGVLWTPTADILLTVSSAQPGRSGGFASHCLPSGQPR